VLDESSIEYLPFDNKTFQEKLNTKDYPELMINSINMTQMLDYVLVANWINWLIFLWRELIFRKTGLIILLLHQTHHISFFDKL
jgi:aspartate racemase